MKETAIQQAFQNAKLNTGGARLYNLAVDLLRESGGNIFVSRQSFIEAVLKDSDVLKEFVSELALTYLGRVKADMDGSAIVKTEADGGGHFTSDAQRHGAPASSQTGSMPAVAERTSQHTHDTQRGDARPSALPLQTPSIKMTGRGQSSGDVQRNPTSPYSILTWSPHDIGDKSRLTKTPYKKPPDRVSAKDQLPMKTLVAKTVLDEFKVRGRSIGDWTPEEALGAAEAMDQDAKRLRVKAADLEQDSKILRAFAHGIPPGRKIGEFVSPKEAENILKNLGVSYAA
jgi:hypothetical protein